MKSPGVPRSIRESPPQPCRSFPPPRVSIGCVIHSSPWASAPGFPQSQTRSFRKVHRLAGRHRDEQTLDPLVVAGQRRGQGEPDPRARSLRQGRARRRGNLPDLWRDGSRKTIHRFPLAAMDGNARPHHHRSETPRARRGHDHRHRLALRRTDGHAGNGIVRTAIDPQNRQRRRGGHAQTPEGKAPVPARIPGIRRGHRSNGPSEIRRPRVDATRWQMDDPRPKRSDRHSKSQTRRTGRRGLRA